MAQVTLAQWADKTTKNMGHFAKAIKTEVLGGIINDTRVDTGLLRGNWQTGKAPIDSTTTRLDQSGGFARAEMGRAVTVDGVEFMTNNLPYAAVWEERDAMIEKNFLRVNGILMRLGHEF